MPSRRATSATPADGRGMATADRRTSRLGAMGPAPPSPRRQEVCHLHFLPLWYSPYGGYRQSHWQIGWETIHLHVRNTHVEGHRRTSSSVAPDNDYFRNEWRIVSARLLRPYRCYQSRPSLVRVLARPPSKQHERPLPAGRLDSASTDYSPQERRRETKHRPVSVFANYQLAAL